MPQVRAADVTFAEGLQCALCGAARLRIGVIRASEGESSQAIGRRRRILVSFDFAPRLVLADHGLNQSTDHVPHDQRNEQTNQKKRDSVNQRPVHADNYGKGGPVIPALGERLAAWIS